MLSTLEPSADRNLVLYQEATRKSDVLLRMIAESPSAPKSKFPEVGA